MTTTKNKKYQVIYADPPWQYTESSNVLVSEGNWGTIERKGRNTDKKKIYPTLTKQELMELKINKYQIVYADPPWKYDNRIDKASNGKSSIDIANHYPSMSDKEICALPIKDMVDKDAACFMWTTDTHMPQALEVMKAWGFTYKTIVFIWEKQTNKGNPVCVMSPWTHKSYEICLLGTRGAMMKNKKDNTIRQMVKAERTRHSAKPQEVADRITRMFPDCTRIELFARDAKPGWDVWGNEIDNTIEL